MIKINDNEFNEIVSYVRNNYGVNLEKKRPLIEGRLGLHLYTLGYDNFKDYFEFAKKDPTKQEMGTMIARLTTNHTYFMREEQHFKYFNNTILRWIDEDLKEKDLRIWSAGCSSGPEPYTLSMVILDHYETVPARPNTVVLASDISGKVLSEGRKGIYKAAQLEELPERWLKKYFVSIGDDQWQVNDKLRKNVAYKKINLLDNFDVKKPFHVIFCRNVMIYFDNPTKEELVQKFFDAMIPGGFLIIGHSESLSVLKQNFDYLRPSIYRKPF